MVLRDGYHITIVFLLKNLQPVMHYITPFEFRSDKYIIMRRIAQEVERWNADTVMIIGEIWIGPPDPEKPFLYPSEMRDRKEGLQLHICTESGEEYIFRSIISRDGQRVSLGKIKEDKVKESWVFEPVKKYWREAGKIKR